MSEPASTAAESAEPNAQAWLGEKKTALHRLFAIGSNSLEHASIGPQIHRRVFVVGRPFHTPDSALPFQGQKRQCDQPGVEENPYG